MVTMTINADPDPVEILESDAEIEGTILLLFPKVQAV